MKSRYNPILLAIVLVGFCCALWLNVVRHGIEQNNDTVEMAMEYENLRKLAALEGLPEETVLERFKAAGITSLMVFDTTLERLNKNGTVTVATGEELRKSVALGGDAGVFEPVLKQKKLQNNAVYIAEGNDKEAFNDVMEDLRLRYGSERIKMIDDKPRIVEVLGSTALLPEDKYDEPLGLLQAPLGLPATDMRRIAAMGFHVIVRPQNYTDISAEQIDGIFKRIKKANVKVTAYMPCGTQAVGYPNMLDYMAAKMKEQGMKLVMMEHYTQLQFAKIDGLLPLAAGVEYNAARSYVIDPTEQKKISVGEALRRWALTDEERNIRVNYIRPFMMSKDGKDLMTMNLEYVQNIVKSVKARGFNTGEAGVFEAAGNNNGNIYAGPYFPDKMVYLPLIGAIMAAVVLYLSLLVNITRRRQLLLWAGLSLAAAVVLMIGRGLLTRQLLALAAAVTFPVLSMSVIFNIWDNCRERTKKLSGIIGNALWQLAFAILLSLVGAMLLSAVLTDSRFLLEIDIYRGVKITFILPVVMTALLYAKKYDLLQIMGRGIRTIIWKLKGFINTDITFKHLLVLGILLFVVYYFVGRSGHTDGVPVTAAELKMRALLEQLMYARPRGKEFLVGHPAFFLAVLAAYKGAPRLWQFVLACGAVIGQGSLVQTFCHMRTPVWMSVMRAVDGYVAGAILGIIGVTAVMLLLPYWERLRRRYLE